MVFPGSLPASVMAEKVGGGQTEVVVVEVVTRVAGCICLCLDCSSGDHLFGFICVGMPPLIRSFFKRRHRRAKHTRIIPAFTPGACRQPPRLQNGHGQPAMIPPPRLLPVMTVPAMLVVA